MVFNHRSISYSYSFKSYEQSKDIIHCNNQDINMHLNYPKVFKKFLHYNTGLSSNTSVERLFSTGGNIMSLKRFS